MLDYTDGLSAEFAEWRFNLGSSNTEPLVRLNVETRDNPVLLRDKVEGMMIPTPATVAEALLASAAATLVTLTSLARRAIHAC